METPRGVQSVLRAKRVGLALRARSKGRATKGENLFVNHYLKTMVNIRPAVPLSAGYNYRCIEDYVLDRGVPHLSGVLTPSEHATLKAAVKNCVTKKFEKKQCFYNAQLLAIADVSRQLTDVEGYAACGLIPLHHGWCALNGKVIDVTWTDSAGHPVYGAIPEGWEYVGVPFDTDLIAKRAFASGVVQTMLDDFENQWPLFKQARVKSAESVHDSQ